MWTTNAMAVKLVSAHTDLALWQHSAVLGPVFFTCWAQIAKIGSKHAWRVLSTGADPPPSTPVNSVRTFAFTKPRGSPNGAFWSFILRRRRSAHTPLPGGHRRRLGNIYHRRLFNYTRWCQHEFQCLVCPINYILEGNNKFANTPLRPTPGHRMRILCCGEKAGTARLVLLTLKWKCFLEAQLSYKI